MRRQKVLRAGAAQVDITPRGPVHLAGAVGAYRPARFVLDPLFAKALILECGEKRLCLLSLDVTIVDKDITSKIRSAASQHCALEPEAILVHATQTHSAPALGHFMVDEDFQNIPSDFEWLKGGESSYFDFAVERALEAVKCANECLRPVRLRAGSGIEGRVAFNRRAVTNNGRVRMPGPRWTDAVGPTYIRHLEGPIDPELGVLCFQDESLEPVALVLHYTCHPVNVFPKPLISADWPGAWAEELARTFGTRCVSLVLNGCCGNINPWDPFDPDYTPDHRRMGRILAETALKVLETLPLEEETGLDWAVQHVKLPIREVEPNLLEESRRYLAEHPEPFRSDETSSAADPKWVQAASIVSVALHRRRQPELDYEIQVFRVRRVALIGLPGEPFVEGQLRIKMNSPAYRTFVAHCVTHYVGYLPTRDAFERGGHEVETRFWSKLTPDALNTVVNAASRLLEKVFST